MAGKPSITLTMSAAHFELCAKLYNPSTPELLQQAVRPVLVDGVAPADARAPYAAKVTRQGQNNYMSTLREIYTETVMKMSSAQFDLCVQLAGPAGDRLTAGARAVLVDGKANALVAKANRAHYTSEALEEVTDTMLEIHWRILGVYSTPKMNKGK
jgi:hypothetical protein